MLQAIRDLSCASLVAAALGLSACSGGSGDAGLPRNLEDITQPVQPAVPSAPYAKALGDCTFNPARNGDCPLSELPFLGQDHATATVDLIMQRVAVSHPWMALRFREALTAQPPELLQMARSITAVIIGSEVRPSFYNPATGAIYLDPESLWLTPTERATINPTPDARIEFGKDMQFRAIWRYVINNDYAYPFYPESFSGSRTLDDTRIALGRLLAHELAHAGDFSPPAQLAGLSRNQTVAAAIDAQSSQWISTRLKGSMPLTSTTWPGLAQVLYANASPTAEQRGYTPEQAGALMEPDRAADAYGYFSQYEDIAMMAEELLSYCWYGMQRDFAMSNRPASGDFVVGWGVRGRIAEPAVNQAARFVVGELLPGVSLDNCLTSLPAPVRLRVGATWDSNLDPSGATNKAAKTTPIMRTTDQLPPG